MHLAPLVVELYESLIRSSKDPEHATLEHEVAVAVMISSICRDCPQGNITKEDAEEWKDVALRLVDQSNGGAEWRETVQGVFDELIKVGDATEERRPPEDFHDYYLFVCSWSGRTPVQGKLT